MESPDTRTTEIVVNGQPRDISQGQSILGLLDDLKLDPARVAVELDGEIIKKDRWARTTLQPGARLEIVQFVGGG